MSIISSAIDQLTFICLLMSSFITCSSLDLSADLKKKSILTADRLFFSFSVKFRTSEPYITTGFSMVLYIHFFVFGLTFFCHVVVQFFC